MLSLGTPLSTWWLKQMWSSMSMKSWQLGSWSMHWNTSLAEGPVQSIEHGEQWQQLLQHPQLAQGQHEFPHEPQEGPPGAGM